MSTLWGCKRHKGFLTDCNKHLYRMFDILALCQHARHAFKNTPFETNRGICSSWNNKKRSCVGAGYVPVDPSRFGLDALELIHCVNIWITITLFNMFLKLTLNKSFLFVATGNSSYRNSYVIQTKGPLLFHPEVPVPMPHQSEFPELQSNHTQHLNWIMAPSHWSNYCCSGCQEMFTQRCLKLKKTIGWGLNERENKKPWSENPLDSEPSAH